MDRNQALLALIEEAHRGDFHFPTSAKLAIKIRQTLDDPECHLDAAGKLIQAEPLLAAQVISIANSVVYNPSGREITDIRTATSRLGFTTLRTMAMAFVTRQMAGTASSPEQQRMATALWEHTAHVAALSQVIATKVTHCNRDTALFAGLVHEIGGFYLLSRATQYPCLLEPQPTHTDDTLDDKSMDRIAVENNLGLAVLRQLAVPSQVIEAGEQYAQGYLSMPPKTLGDTLMLADYLAPVASPLMPTESTQDNASLDFAFGDGTLTEILAESTEEVNSLTGALR